MGLLGRKLVAEMCEPSSSRAHTEGLGIKLPPLGKQGGED